MLPLLPNLHIKCFSWGLCHSHGMCQRWLFYHFGPPELKAWQADVCSNTFLLATLRMGLTSSACYMRRFPNWSIKKAFIPLENLYNVHPTSLSEETAHRGSQKAVNSWVGNKREPRALFRANKLHKKGQLKTWAAFMFSPRQGNKTIAKITLKV